MRKDAIGIKILSNAFQPCVVFLAVSGKDVLLLERVVLKQVRMKHARRFGCLLETIDQPSHEFFHLCGILVVDPMQIDVDD